MSVSGPADGWYSVTSSNGWSCGVSAEYGVEPKVGDHFVTWGDFGRPIRGVAVARRVLYYRTPAEQEIEDARSAERHRAKRIAEYEGRRATMDERVSALAIPLRRRVEAFRVFGGDAWRWSHEEYEVMCCEEASAIAAAFPTSKTLRAFIALGDYDAQKAAFPAMSGGHSGNSWGFSQRLALHLVEHPELVEQEHGALCPLVGCEDYGCHAVRPATPPTGAPER